MEKIAVALEVGPSRRVFAQALDWVGWCRAGKDEETAPGSFKAAWASKVVLAHRC